MERQCCIPGILGHTWGVITTSSCGVKSNLDAEMKPLLVVGIVLGQRFGRRKAALVWGWGGLKQENRGIEGISTKWEVPRVLSWQRDLLYEWGQGRFSGVGGT